MDFEEDDPCSDSATSMDSADEDDGISIETSNYDNEEEKCDYSIINYDNLLIEMNSLATDTSAVIGISPDICKVLLHDFQWNRENLIEKFYEAGDKEKFLESHNVVDDDGALKCRDKEGCCEICYEQDKVYGLSSDHVYCDNCWRNYLTIKIRDEGAMLITCPGLKCGKILIEKMITAFISDEIILKKYKKLVVNSFVQSNLKLKWCPALDCGRAVKVPHAECRPIKCECSMVFCFNCSQEWHDPVSCDMLKLWLKKCSDDSETSNWLNANTKDCPKCHVTIEKDGGCNHMTCKNVSCRFEFCWTCLGPWKPHGSGWYSCNRFDDSESKKARDAQERSRAALQRYLHYYNRFVNHQNSLKLENKEKMLQMQQRGFSWIETQFLKKAVDVLSECRRTLMYTYAFAFYLKQDNMTNIFEGNQQDLELATEQLSEFLERDLEKENLVSLKQKVQDKYRYVQQRRTALLEHVTEGREKNEWSFTVTF
uniref:RBR-type E3 ubiquitin transferase n=1 Tax=Bursaphelenchus xylophilus TaxID=6326 RepID=A0A1I7S7D3_BURXY